jgi:hypothetical protein
MTSMSELKRMLEGEGPTDGSRPDVLVIIGRGRRLRRRRRLGVASVAAACCLSIAIPVAVRVATEDGRGADAPVAPNPDRDSQRPDSTAQPSLPKLSGAPCLDPWWRCSEGGGPGRPLGAVVDTGTRIDGVPVLLWAERREHYYEPNNTDSFPRVPTLTLGYPDPASGRPTAAGVYLWWEQPDPAPPELTLLMLAVRDDGPWFAAGTLTDPDATAVVAAESDGSPVEVELSEQEVSPGMRVFWASGDDYSDPDLPGVVFRVLDAEGDTLESCVLGGDLRGGCLDLLP